MDPSQSGCPSCGAPVLDAFCGACGERRFTGSELSLRSQIGQLVGGLFNVDGKVPRTFGALVARPGFLSVEYCRGARVRWVRPVQLFLLANLIYFLLQPATGFNSFRSTLDMQLHHQIYSGPLRRRVEASLPAPGRDCAKYAASFDRTASELARSLVILLVPITALAMHAVARRGRRTYVEHLVLAANFVSFQLVFIYVGYLALVGWSKGLAFVRYNEVAGMGVTLILLGCWLVPAWRRFHGTSFRTALLKGSILCLAQIPIVLAYRYLLFWLTYWIA